MPRSNGRPPNRKPKKWRLLKDSRGWKQPITTYPFREGRKLLGVIIVPLESK